MEMTMNKVLKLKQHDDVKVFFTSDTHYNHNPKWEVPLWESRGYKTLEESNTHIIKSINDTVGENDILFHLGDLTLNCNEEQFEQFIGSLKCKTIYTLWGNHNSPSWNIYQREITEYFRKMDDDFTSTQPKPELEIYPFRYKNVVFLGNYSEVIVDGMYFVLSHYPIHSWNHMRQGSIHLYGHMHCKNNPIGGKQMDVGWDETSIPYSFKEIMEIMNKKEIKSDGGHH